MIRNTVRFVSLLSCNLPRTKNSSRPDATASATVHSHLPFLRFGSLKFAWPHELSRRILQARKRLALKEPGCRRAQNPCRNPRSQTLPWMPRPSASSWSGCWLIPCFQTASAIPCCWPRPSSRVCEAIPPNSKSAASALKFSADHRLTTPMPIRWSASPPAKCANG